MERVDRGRVKGVKLRRLASFELIFRCDLVDTSNVYRCQMDGECASG